MLTFLPLEEINKMAEWEGSKLNEAKDILAYELTALVHGEEEANAARASSRALFAGGAAAEIPTVALSEDILVDGAADIITLLVSGGLADSRSDARRAVEQGGVSADGDKVTNIKATFTKEQIAAGIVLKKGKKIFKKITF